MKTGAFVLLSMLALPACAIDDTGRASSRSTGGLAGADADCGHSLHLSCFAR